jgi:hypothetical protein
MSRGFGRHQRLILAELKETEAFYLSDLFPPDDQQKPFARRGHETSEVVALRRAARSLRNAGKIARYYDGGVRGRLVIARPGARLSRQALIRQSVHRRRARNEPLHWSQWSSRVVWCDACDEEYDSQCPYCSDSDDCT